MFDKGVSGLAGAAGAGWSAFRNNQKVKKGVEGLTHMDVKTAMQQGRTNGMKNRGGLSQFTSQGQKVYESTYGYGKSRDSLVENQKIHFAMKNMEKHMIIM